MNANNPKSTVRRATTLAALCVAVVSVIAIRYQNSPRKTPAGQIIEQFGIFTSPHGNCIVTLKALTAEQWIVKTSANTATGTPSTSASFDRSRAWFGAWDDKDRFWTYIDGVGVHVQRPQDPRRRFGGLTPAPLIEKAPRLMAEDLESPGIQAVVDAVLEALPAIGSGAQIVVPPN